jgi:hypothetical protein
LFFAANYGSWEQSVFKELLIYTYCIELTPETFYLLPTTSSLAILISFYQLFLESSFLLLIYSLVITLHSLYFPSGAQKHWTWVSPSDQQTVPALRWRWGESVEVHKVLLITDRPVDDPIYPRKFCFQVLKLAYISFVTSKCKTLNLEGTSLGSPTPPCSWEALVGTVSTEQTQDRTQNVWAQEEI